MVRREKNRKTHCYTLLTSPLRVSLAISWKSCRNFNKTSEPQKMKSQHQKMKSQHHVFPKKKNFEPEKRDFQHQFLVSVHRPADAQKTAQTHLCTRFAPVGKNRAPIPPPPRAPKLAKRFKPATGWPTYLYVYLYTW